MTTAERVQALVDHGFTERQARFLVLVMRHSGLCVKRQYAAFAGIANGGEKCNAFFAKLVRRRYALATPCIHGRARLYHVHHAPLYHAIGEPDSRYRRTVPARAAGERLMRLDATLTSPDLEWLTTRAEKLAYLRTTRASQAVGGPPEGSAAEDEGPPGTFPIGVGSGGHLVVLYLATVPWTDDFRTFLIGHTPWLAAAPGWTLRIVFPQALRRLVAAYEGVAHEELASPLEGETVRQLRTYFFHRRRGTDRQVIPDGLRAILKRYAEVFGGPRFTHLYKRWLRDEDAPFTPVPLTIQEAFLSGRAHVESLVLPHSYDHLAPLVAERRLRRAVARQWEEKGDETPSRINPSINPVP